MPRSGIASGQRVLRSIIVRRYVKPEEKGKGPTISMFMCDNLSSVQRNVLVELLCGFVFLNFDSDDILSPIY